MESNSVGGGGSGRSNTGNVLEIENNMVITAEQEAVILRHSKNSAFRFQGLGAKADDLQKIFAQVTTISEWLPAFTKLAQQYERSADEMVHEESKMITYLIAATYYHVGELLTFIDNDDKRKAFNSFRDAYLKAMPFFPFPTETVEIPFGNVTLPGYFRRIGGMSNAPTVILIRGVDACREVELQIISNHFLRKGFFTIAVDLPGQGQARMRGMKMTPDFEKPVGAVVDYLKKIQEVDVNHIGVVGMSFGGFIAPKAAALEKRIKACVSLSGFYSLSEYPPALTAKFHRFNDMGVTNEAQWRETQKGYTLEGVIDKLTCPYYITNGSEDKVTPASQNIKMYEKAPGPNKEIKILPGLGHCAFYQKPEILSEIADWMKKQFGI